MPKIVIPDNYHFISAVEQSKELIAKYVIERLKFIRKYSKIKVIKIGISEKESAYSEIYSAMDQQHVLLLQIVNQDSILGNIDKKFIYEFLYKKICNVEESDFEVIYTEEDESNSVVLKNDNIAMKIDLELNSIVLQLLQQRKEILDNLNKRKK